MTAVSSALLLIGCGFLLLAAVGILRMPDLYIRMSSSSKALTLGIGCLALGLALDMDDASVTTRVILLILLFLLKAPVAAHLLGRAAYRSGVPLWEATVVDEMKGVFAQSNHDEETRTDLSLRDSAEQSATTPGPRSEDRRRP